MKTTLRKLGVVCAMAMALNGLAAALEVEDLNATPLTLTHANDHFGRDYSFTVLEDLSVRRIWQAEGKTITIDFNFSTGKAIAIFIDYKSTKNIEEAKEDTRTLVAGRTDKIKWTNVKKKTAEKLGLLTSRYMRLEDDSMLIWEKGAKGGCSRLCWFAGTPKENRMELDEASENAGKTALGNSGMAQGQLVVKIRESEQRQLNSPVPQSSLASAARPDKSPKPAAKPAPAKKAPVAATQPQKTDDEFEDERADNLLQQLGIEADNEMIKWGAICGGVLILIIIIGAIRSSRRKARQRAAFNQILHATPENKKAANK